jgi:hypothetical protein
VTEVWRDEASAQATLAAPPPTDGPAADVLALLPASLHRTDLTVLGGVGVPTDGLP